jgi:hypothetical protein
MEESMSAYKARTNKFRVVLPDGYTEYHDTKRKAVRSIRTWFRRGRLETKDGDSWVELPIGEG